MSYILEALKKADNKRKLGAVPDLHSDHDQDMGEEPKRALWPYVIAALLFGNAALIGWWIGPWQKTLPTETAMVEVADIEQAEEIADADLLKPDNLEAGLSSTAAEERLELKSRPVVGGENVPVGRDGAGQSSLGFGPADRIGTTTPGEVTADSGGELSDRRISAMGNSERLPQLSGQVGEQEVVSKVDSGPRGPMAAPRRIGQPPVTAGEIVENETFQEVAGPEAASLESSVLVNPEISSPEYEGDEIVSPDLLDSEETGEEAEEEGPEVKEFKAFDLAKVPYIYQLPVSIQNKLPDIKISFHSYTHRPATRVVRINGHIKREGQSLDKGITLEKIIPKGVVLMYENRLFRLDV